jgi:hypothetical protein
VDRRLYFPAKDVMLRIFIALKNPSSLAGFEPEILGSNSKHANHYTTDSDKINVNIIPFVGL